MLTDSDSPEIANLDLETQAAISFVRGQTVKALADDLLRGPVTRAATEKKPRI
jgi:hypothetical protein